MDCKFQKETFGNFFEKVSFNCKHFFILKKSFYLEKSKKKHFLGF